MKHFPARTICPLVVVGPSALLAVALWGCSDQPMTPEARRPSYSYPTDPIGPALDLQDTTSDKCTLADGNVPNKCHTSKTQPAPLAGDSNYVCPGGCRSFPLTTEMQDSTFDALGLVESTPECAEVYDYMSFQLRSQVVRYVRDPWQNFG